MTTVTREAHFSGRVLLLGCGSVSQCLQPLLLRHLDMNFANLTVMDIEDLRDAVPGTLERGARYIRYQITPDNLAVTLNEYLSAGDLLINLSWNIEAGDIIGWCHENGVLYIDTSVETWDPYTDLESTHPLESTLYSRHQKLRKQAACWGRGPTAVVEHGANPGLVSHWTKVALEDVATAMLESPNELSRPLTDDRRNRIERVLGDGDYARLAMETGTKTIHISERDTQISARPKEVGEFVNTWSVDGFHEEGLAPAELGWGTHEQRLPEYALVPERGPGNVICLARPGINTWVWSWVPHGGQIIGMVIRHGEAVTISDRLTVWHEDQPQYRPTVHYAYLPTDAAMASLHECQMRGFELQENQRIMNDDIISGMDELGVLLLGHDLGGWWVGSQLGIDEARSLVPHQNATTMQVASSILGALFWILRNPNCGLCVPDDLDHREVLSVAEPYLGPSPSLRTDWAPPVSDDPFYAFRGEHRVEDNCQFANFLVSFK